MDMLSAFSLYPFFIFFLFNLTFLSLSRAGLAIWQRERVTAVNGWKNLFLQGIRMDIVSLCWLYSPVVLLSTLFLDHSTFGQYIALIIRFILVAGSCFILFMELATPAFIATYDFRPNRLFIEYLVNPKEVFTMLLKGHLLSTLAVPVFSITTAYLLWQLSGHLIENANAGSWLTRPIIMLVAGALTFIGARSSFRHRGINPAMVAFSSDPLINSLVLNSGYSLLFAARQMLDEENATEIYGKMSPEQMIEILKQTNARPASAYLNGDIPMLSHNPASYRGKPKNLVIILEESLGAQFVGTLGGLPLSPNFDRLAKQGWLFEQLYATGTRSVRGIEAVISGFTPTPARAVVKLPNSQHDFFTLAALLSQKNYHTSFIYGGEKHFDNMAGFFYGNGFQQIIDEKDYTNPTFKGTWGVSDEDLFDKAHHRFQQLYAQDKPFFSLVFTSSNHDPFEFPENKIDLYEQPKHTRNNAAKYADYALGHFFNMAQQADYWNDTIFLIVADHDSRVYGSSLVPIQHFRIPGLILGGGIETKRDPRLISQIDLPTTLLSLIGIDADYPMLGYDLTQTANPNRAMMQFDKTLAFMQGDDVAILLEGQAAKGFRYNYQTHKLTEQPLDPSLKQQALAYSLWGSYTYKNRLFRLAK
ncbi:hypothetical protein CEP48_05800 [Mergibacter septicus]|uniref:Uncharacterized protein n=2 Tax=Mergibacter septicus TaxID=221402 RepID=A0A8D4IYD4_9PAST|nr:LTA synthase family protein [Mergibacter septicus]AWX15714.1 hypothetical protein CEP47_05800 [Mergibacter septicus]QDJ14967.1 hypothetical protein CEP48_05800 [Mergibacter septicus]UTU47608.1 LTA synthase family protein [Mergibacter septicus]WMR96786.1 LTA synthase family protein [Mergibacter septicus]